VSHNLNDVFEVADRIVVLYLGRMVAEDAASKFDRQVVVDYMTTGQSSRELQSTGAGAGSNPQASERKQ
jgi:ABC-type sugar transport system ATPase subunit